MTGALLKLECSSHRRPAAERRLSVGSSSARRASSTSTAKRGLLLALALLLFFLWQRTITWPRSEKPRLRDAPVIFRPGDLIRPSFDHPKRSNDGLTTDVEWDQYSLFIKGQRTIIWSGEVHPWRLPVPTLWRDLAEKTKAAGFNTISIYVNWALVMPRRGVTDWTGYRDLQMFLDFCKSSGLWIILRPGPHIQAEVSAGGIAYWALGIEGELRTNASDYREAWTQYITEVAEIARRNQVTEGGPIIAVQVENEVRRAVLAHDRGGLTPGLPSAFRFQYYQRLDKDGQRRGDKGKWQWNKIAHVEELKTALRAAGVVVPLT